MTVRCRSTRRRGGGITCRLSFAGGAPGAITAKLVRGGRNYAVAHKRVNGKRTRIKLRQVRRAKRGAYTLKLRDANSRTIASVKVSLR